jgi:beta-glucosidase-like glycosyl hydrolase
VILAGAQTNCIQLKSGKIVCPTSFPNPVNYGMTFNVSLFQELGQVIATELRALWLLGATEYSAWSGRGHAGLDCWSPNINIARDPRWGRNQETPSEDPYLNGLFGYWYTKGNNTRLRTRYLFSFQGYKRAKTPGTLK